MEATPDRRRKSGTIEKGSYSDYSNRRMSASSVLSYLESRPGIIDVTEWKQVSGRSLTDRPGLTREEKQRAEAVADALGLSLESKADFYRMLLDAEEFGVWLEVEVEEYGEVA